MYKIEKSICFMSENNSDPASSARVTMENALLPLAVGLNKANAKKDELALNAISVKKCKDLFL